MCNYVRRSFIKLGAASAIVVAQQDGCSSRTTRSPTATTRTDPISIARLSSELTIIFSRISLRTEKNKVF